MTDSSVFSALTAFEHDLLYAVRALERDGDPPKGLAVKEYLDDEYEDEVNHSRLYQNLDRLVDGGLLTKGQKNDRTNEYATTEDARELLEARTKQRAEQVGLRIDSRVRRRDETCSELVTSSITDPENVAVLFNGEEMDLGEAAEDSGTWTYETDDGCIQVTLKWNANFFTHTSALVGPDEELVPLDFESPSARRTDPVFVPTSDHHDFRIKLVRADASSNGDGE